MFETTRRNFISLVGGAAAALPSAGLAQPADRVRRIGVLAGSEESDTRARIDLAAFQQELHRLGWAQEHNVRIEYRFTSDPT
jgi:putative tryptophan/tyrosine transport system substrate-binding protein